jgi:LacI family transcriptional regulator
VQHLVSLGHDRIAHIAGPQNVSTGRGRCEGFTEAMEAERIELPAHRVSFARAYNETQGAMACARLLASDPQITAIVAANDTLALGCCDTLGALDLRCPQDVSIVGFNDMQFVDRVSPPLTTVRVPQREIGTIAAELLLEALAGAGRPVDQILFGATLVVRGSTAAAPA